MAVITGNKNGKPVYKPGIIYEIRHTDPENPAYTIYVGETTDMARRRKEHQKRYASDAEGNAQYVHDILDMFDKEGIMWDLVPVSTYDDRGPGGPEYDAVVGAVRRGCSLCNVRSGNQALADRVETDIKNMQILGFEDPAEYRAYKEDPKNRPKIIANGRKKEAKSMEKWVNNKYTQLDTMPQVDANGRRLTDYEVLQGKLEYEQRVAKTEELRQHPQGATVATLERLHEDKKAKVARLRAELEKRMQGDL